MSEPFPRLELVQVTLARAERNTGIVLDEDLHRAVSDLQRTYTIYNTYKDAVEAAVRLVSSRPDIECIIQDKDEKLLQYIHSDNLSEFIDKL